MVAIWAKVGGYPSWPARYCSLVEEQQLVKSSKGNGKKSNQKSVIFLGSRLDRAWVPEGSIDDFNTQSFNQKFSEKKFFNDRDYRLAVIEAIRLSLHNGEIFDDKVMDLIKNHATEQETAWDRIDVCSVCGGTECSGPSLLCDRCEIGETHFHCLSKPILVAPEGSWMCMTCCDLTRTDPESFFLPKEEIEIKDTTVVSEEVSLPATVEQTAPESSKKRKLSTNGSKSSTSNRKSLSNPSHKRQIKELEDFNIKSKLFNKSSCEESYQQDRQQLMMNDHINHINPTPDSFTGQSNLTNHHNHHPLPSEEVCSICHEGGNVILCDYPQCQRVYHHVCVYATVPTALDTEQYVEEVWFCPKHYCIGCHGLDSSTTHHQQLPKVLQTNSLLLKSKPLKSCYNCSFSICEDCETDVIQSAVTSVVSLSTAATHVVVDSSIENTPPAEMMDIPSSDDIHSSISTPAPPPTIKGGAIFRNRRGHVLECMNCSSIHPIFQLAKQLEKAWMKLASSRLAIPFLHPFLPLQEPIKDDSNHCNPSNRVKVEYLEFYRQYDLLYIQQKIHRLEYENLPSLFNDLQILYQKLIYTIELTAPITTAAPGAAVVYDLQEMKFKQCTVATDGVSCPSSSLSSVMELTSLPLPELNSQRLKSSQESLIRPQEKGKAAGVVYDCNIILNGFHTILDALQYYLLKDKGLLIDSIVRKIQSTPPIGTSPAKKHRSKSPSLSNTTDYSTCANGTASVSEELLTYELIQSMRAIWRKECHETIYHRVLSQVPPSLCEYNSISPKTIAHWSIFIQQGVMPTTGHGKAYLDPYSIWQPSSAKRQELCCEQPVYDTLDPEVRGMEYIDLMLRAEDEACQAITAELRHGNTTAPGYLTANQRETVTMLEDRSGEASVWRKYHPITATTGGDDDGEADLLDDEAGVMLDRIKDFSLKTLQLHARLKRIHNRSYSNDANQRISFGEAKIIRELKSQVDNLSWQLQQRNRIISSNTVFIHELQGKLLSSQHALLQAEQEKNDYKIQVAVLQHQLQQGKPAGVTVGGDNSVAIEKDDSIASTLE